MAAGSPRQVKKTIRSKASYGSDVRRDAFDGALIDLIPAAVYTCDAEGHITFFNKRAEQLWGRRPRLGDADQKFCGSLRLYYVDGTPLPHNRTPMAAALESGRPYHDQEVIIERPDGSTVTVLVNIDPLLDEQGKPRGAINVFQDISERRRMAEENRAQRGLLERIIREVPAGIAFLRGPEHRFTLANPGYMSIARGKGEIVGRTVEQVWPEVSETVIPLLDDVFRTEKPFHSTDMALEVMREWGPETIYVTFTYTPMYAVDGTVEGVLALVQETTEAVKARQQLEEERAQLRELTATLESRIAERTSQVRELASALTLAEQRERARISQVLHDDLQQLLYSQLMRMEMLRQELPDEQRQKLQELLRGMTEQLEQSVRVTRALTAELNPPKVKMGDLQEALHWLAGHMEETHGLKVTVSGDVSGAVSRDDTRDLLLQMVRELLFNVVKHARSDRAKVTLAQQNGALVVRVEDEGAGFKTTELKPTLADQDGLGLFSISNRLELIGGELQIDSTPGEGTRVTITAPVD